MASGKATSTNSMVEESPPASSTILRTTTVLMLPSVLLDTVFPARSAVTWMGESPFTMTAPKSRSESLVLATAGPTIFTGMSFPRDHERQRVAEAELVVAGDQGRHGTGRAAGCGLDGDVEAVVGEEAFLHGEVRRGGVADRDEPERDGMASPTARPARRGRRSRCSRSGRAPLPR
ncbi:MAG: hypothetical protein R2717_06080 [Schumannella sp.]